MTVESRPSLLITSDDPEAIVRAQSRDKEPIALYAVPPKPFALGRRGLVAHGVLRNEADCEAALVALARGVDLVAVLHLSDALSSSFLDDAARLADLVETNETGRPELTTEQAALLDGLAQGGTLTTVASALGMSRRTATRRLTDARKRFGVDTTVELLRAARAVVDARPREDQRISSLGPLEVVEEALREIAQRQVA